jgi:hypothetical protein
MTGNEATGAVVSAYVDGTSAAEEGDGEVFCGCLDVLLVACDCGEAEASVCELIYYIVVVAILNLHIECLFFGGIEQRRRMRRSLFEVFHLD